MTKLDMGMQTSGRAGSVRYGALESLSMVRHWSLGLSSWHAAKVVNSCEPEKSSTSQICRAERGTVGRYNRETAEKVVEL